MAIDADGLCGLMPHFADVLKSAIPSHCRVVEEAEARWYEGPPEREETEAKVELAAALVHALGCVFTMQSCHGCEYDGERCYLCEHSDQLAYLLNLQLGAFTWESCHAKSYPEKLAELPRVAGHDPDGLMVHAAYALRGLAEEADVLDCMRNPKSTWPTWSGAAASWGLMPTDGEIG